MLALNRLTPLLFVLVAPLSLLSSACDITVGGLPDQGGSSSGGTSAAMAREDGEGGVPSCELVLQLDGALVDDIVVEEQRQGHRAHPAARSLQASSWSVQGLARRTRSYFKPPLPELPESARITRATLTLHAGAASDGCFEAGGGHSRRDGDNAVWWGRALTPWREETLGWEQQPTLAEEALLPASETNFDDYQVDLSDYARGVYELGEPHLGFGLKLREEAGYRSLCFAGSDSADATSRPTLAIAYSGAPCCAAPPPGLVAWWKGDMSDPPVVGPSLDFERARAREGRVGRAFELDGRTAYVDVADGSELNFGTGDLTIALWVLTEDARGIGVLIDKRVEEGGLAPIGLGYVLYLSGGVPVLRLGDAQGEAPCAAGNAAACRTDFSLGRSVADGQWHHLAVSVERSSARGLRFYLDGELVSTHDPSLRNQSLDNAGKLTLGCRSTSHGGCLAAAFDEVQLYAAALSAPAVRSLFDAGAAGVCRPLP